MTSEWEKIGGAPAPCGCEFAQCKCDLKKGHAGPHVCRDQATCGGVFYGVGPDNGLNPRVPVRLPVLGTMVPREVWDHAAQFYGEPW